MNSLHLLVPPLLLIGLNFTIAILLARKKFQVVRQELLPASFFKLNTGAEMPKELAQISHNYDNLLALPMLFYALISFILATNLFHPAFVVLAWLYVFCRFAHSYVHITSNKLKWRMQTFIWSFLVLICMWLLLLWKLLMDLTI